MALGALALAEAGDVEVLGVLLIRSLQGLFILLTVHTDLQFIEIGIDLIGGNQFHLVVSSRRIVFKIFLSIAYPRIKSYWFCAFPDAFLPLFSSSCPWEGTSIGQKRR